MELAEVLAKEFAVKIEYSRNIISLIDEGNTIPFIARYRKEMTGSCDDQVLRQFGERLTYLRNLEERKQQAEQSITEQGKWSEEIGEQLARAATLAEVEDIYRPFKQKRRTRATMARERGLEPLADMIIAQNMKCTLMEAAAPYVDAEKGVLTWEDAVSGAQDILAERISDDAELRKVLRGHIRKNGKIESRAAKDEDSVYKTYYDFSGPLLQTPGHRILAMNRGEKEGFLKIDISMDESLAIAAIRSKYVKGSGESGECVLKTIDDAWSRLLWPSLEREIRNELTEKAEEGAIHMFALNLKPLLMQPPVKGKVTMGFDPAYRTGCKIAVVDGTGKMLESAVVYPTPPQNRQEEAKTALKKLIQKHGVSCIAIGNGTASRESELFVAGLIKELPEKVSYMVVNEAGASVYSASPLGAKEFPELDVSIRSAVSIARRLQDPLAELVKIDPKSIGVGQYQHDMPGAELDSALFGVVEDCVNSVGVDLNTASVSLLSYISGLNASVAEKIVEYRNQYGAFASRSQLKKVPRLGPKAFEQCAGFLRIPGGADMLDNTSVHPESYGAVKKLLGLLGISAADMGARKTTAIELGIREAGEEKIAQACGIGVPTLRDIMGELKKPGRDIRDELPPPILRTDVLSMEDLKPGMELTGTVRNVVDFGVFVDIGVHQDGLVHISQMAERYLKHPSEAAAVGDIVSVTVLDVDVKKGRISLSMRNSPKSS
jgi:uncharacterized protein